MTRQIHDQFAKEYLEELLTPFGTVKINRNVRGEVRQVDVWFDPATPSPISELGLLGRMAATACIFEPYRNAPSEIEIRSCFLKLYALHGELLRRSRREEQTILETKFPQLWILAPSCSSRIVSGFGANVRKEWGEGVYFVPDFFRGAIIATNQLPKTEETLWLRVLGRGKTQQQAVEELLALPDDNLFRNNLLDALANWRKTIEIRDNVTEDDREVIMNLSAVYLRQREEWKQEGLQEGLQQGLQQGRQQGLRLMVENLLKVRFGTISEALEGIIDRLLRLEEEEIVRSLLTLSHEELLSRFGGEEE